MIWRFVFPSMPKKQAQKPDGVFHICENKGNQYQGQRQREVERFVVKNPEISESEEQKKYCNNRANNPENSHVLVLSFAETALCCLSGSIYSFIGLFSFGVIYLILFGLFFAIFRLSRKHNRSSVEPLVLFHKNSSAGLVLCLVGGGLSLAQIPDISITLFWLFAFGGLQRAIADCTRLDEMRTCAAKPVREVSQ